ncbi:uncharacterized protein LOC110857051 isoform X2 [Folsomia candida]|nr:uncharacterized protein LOC110857051 isoform X2 [Folsomia candida]
MPSSNIEIKAKLCQEGGLEQAEKIAADLSKTGEIHLHLNQKDTFFTVPNGRMKLRQENDRNVLITYFRSDTAGPKQSTYSIAPVVEVDKMLETLSRALGVKGVVEKDRKVYLIEYEKQPKLTARIHLDAVKNLGDYFEIEVVLPDDSDDAMAQQGQDFTNELLKKFNIKEDHLIQGAYLDCLDK